MGIRGEVKFKIINLRRNNNECIVIFFKILGGG